MRFVVKKKYKDTHSFYSVIKKCIENWSLTVWPLADAHARSHSGDLISYLDRLWFNITHTHQPAGTDMIACSRDHLLSSFTSRSHISSLSHRCLPPWFTIDLLSLRVTERDAQRGTERYWGCENEWKRKKKKKQTGKGVINAAARLRVCCHAVISACFYWKSSNRKQLFSLFRVENKTFRRSNTESLPPLVFS